jgi:mycothiol synthase
MEILTVRPYEGEQDLQPIADMLNACEAVDQHDEGTSAQELRSEFTSPGFDPGRDIRLWQQADGKLVGFGQLWMPTSAENVDGFLWMKVHPDARGIGLEDDIFAWGEEQIREVGRERGASMVLRSGTRDTDQDRIALYERHGMSVARYFWRMGRSLQDPIPEPQFPEGYTLSYVRGPEDVEAWIAAFNQSFIDHYNHHDMTAEDRLHRMAEPYYVAEQDLIALAPDGTVAAFCVCTINPMENERSGRVEGWINILGTRRGHRKIGLGRAMLYAGLHRLKADGMETALLGVDGANPTGATHLYESAGFRKLLTFVSYAKEL